MTARGVTHRSLAGGAAEDWRGSRSPSLSRLSAVFLLDKPQCKQALPQRDCRGGGRQCRNDRSTPRSFCSIALPTNHASDRQTHHEIERNHPLDRRDLPQNTGHPPNLPRRKTIRRKTIHSTTGTLGRPHPQPSEIEQPRRSVQLNEPERSERAIARKTLEFTLREAEEKTPAEQLNS